MAAPTPTDRELAILDVLWKHGEATVRTVYEELRRELPIVQNTVQAFLRTVADEVSAQLMSALVDAAEVLTVEQRLELMEVAKRFHRR